MISKEYYLQNLLNKCIMLSKAEEKQLENVFYSKIDEIYNILAQNIKESMIQYSNELIVKFMELTSETIPKRHYSEQFISYYFQRFKHPNQFYIRALLVKATLVSQKGHIDNKKGEEMIIVLKDAFSYTTKALDIITGGGPQTKSKDSKAVGQDNSKQKYSFLIYNVSICVYKIIRFMLKSNWQKNFTEVVQRICKLFDEIDQPDHDWRCRFNLILHQCLYDSDKKADAFKVLDQLWQKTKTKNCDFQDQLFKLRVHLSKQNGSLAGSIKKDLQGTGDPKGWKILQVLQRMKSGLIPQPQIQKQLMNVVNSISSAVLIGNETSANKLSPLIQDRLAETGRVALLFNHINVADSITNFLNKARQLSQKAMVLNQYNKAQLLIQKKGPEIDNKTGMKLNSQQLKQQQIERRSQALKILEKVSIINKRLGDSQLIYEGCILIWNVCLPLMTLSQRDIFTKAMQSASQLLQQINSNDHLLRIKFHLQLAKTYFSNQATFSKVQQHVVKAMQLDSSQPLNKITYKYNPQQDLGLYQRPFDRYIYAIAQKSQLKKNHQQRINTQLDKIVIDLWNVVGQKSENTKIDILQKSLGSLVSIQIKDYDYQDANKRSLVQEQIKQEVIKHKQNSVKTHKKKKLLASQIAQLAFEWEINELAENACEIVIQDKWQPQNSLEMILSQVKCYYFLGQLHIDYMIKDNFEAAFNDPIRIDEDQKKQQISQQVKQRVLKQKQKIFKYFSKGVQLADSIQQSWLVFNGAIYIWNNFLHIFKNPSNDSKLIQDLSQLLKQLFQTMKNNLKDNNKKIVSYDVDTKGQIFANIGLICARLMENLKQADEVNRICQALSLTQLSPHTRKLINSIKSRVTTGKVNPGAKKQAPGKGKQIQTTGQNNDVFLFDIVSQLQIIKNAVNKNQTGGLIKKCFQTLQNWKPRQNDETDLELHAQLWARLARLALTQDNIIMFKYSIRCVQNSLSLSPKNDVQISPNRLRWYSLAEYTYGQSLSKMVNPETQDTQTCQKLLFKALSHTVQAVDKGFKCSLNILALDAAKQVWNLCSKLQQSAVNRKNLIKPIYHSLSCLKLLKQKSEVDLLLLLSQLLFKAALQNKQYKIGQSTADMLFELIPKNMQKSLWQAKMIFMSKQGKNELQAISNMKEADSSLQAKLWVKLARASTQINKQHAAYNKAIQILRKQGSVQIVQVLIQYAEWQLRVDQQGRQSIVGNLLLASDYLIDIQYGQDQAQQNLEDDKATIFSRSSRGKKSQISNQLSLRSKQIKTKKQLEKKAVISTKSKGSRMNRTARAANTIKSKNTKSIFVQRQQEANPQSLNCSHYERLFRIHTILALISKTTQQRIRYAFDAKHFLIKILEISFRTLNTMDQNAAKYSNAMQEKKNNATQQYIKKYKVPVQIQDWIKLILPKQFTEKVRTLQDYNFMGVFMFEKPQLTFNYVQQLLTLFQRYGFELHTIPIHFFTRFISKQIINNNWLSQLCDMKFCKTLKKCGFSKDLYQPYQFIRLKLTQTEKKNMLTKANSLKYQTNQSTALDTLYQVPNQIPPPNLVKPYSQRSYEIWARIALQLLDLGQISNSKQLLKQSLIHCKILKDIPTLDKCYLGLTKISLIQGEMIQANNLVLACNKICRNIVQQQYVYETMFDVLISVRKYSQLKKFSQSIIDVVSKFIQDIKKGKKVQTTTHQHQYLQLQHLLTTVVVLNIELSIQQYLNQHVGNSSEVLLESINSIEGEIIHQSNALLYSHYQIICRIFSNILMNLQQGSIEPEYPQFGISINNKLLNILLRLQAQIMNSGKYTLIGVSQQCFKKHNPLINLQHKIRLCISRAYNLQGLLKKAGNVQEIRKKMQRISLLQQDNHLEQKKTSNHQAYEPLTKYLQSLTVKIQKDLAPIQRKLDSYEASISLLRNLENKISEESYMQIQLGMLLMSAQRKRASLKDQLSQVWAQQPNIDQHMDRFDANESLQRSQKFIEKYQVRCGDYIKDQKAFQISRRVYIQMIENRGRIFSQSTFQYLTKFQHYGYLEKLKKRINLWLQDNHTLSSYERLLRRLPIPTQQSIDQISQIHLFESFTKFPSYQQCLQLMPNNSAIITISLSINKNDIYFGMISKVNSLDIGKGPIVSNIVRKIELTQSVKSQYFQLNKLFLSIKSTLAKIPINQIEKYQNLVEQLQVKTKVAMKNFEKLQEWWSKQIQSFLNTQREKTVVIVDPKDTKKQTKQAPKLTKKGGKDQISSYESPLDPSPSGVQSLTILLDTQIYNLPFENLKALSNIPAISRDTSIFFLFRKLQALNYKPQLNNSDNFGMDKCKYMCYDFKTQQQNGESTFLQVSKTTPVIKFEGISTSKRIPSLGQYQQFFSSSNILHIYGSISFINTIKFQPFISSLPINKVKLLLINDNINTHKSILNKFQAIDNGETHCIQQQDIDTVHMANLMNLSLVKTRWSVTVSQNKKIIKEIYKEGGNNIYLSAAIKKVISAMETQLNKMTIFFNGPAVIRL